MRTSCVEKFVPVTYGVQERRLTFAQQVAALEAELRVSLGEKEFDRRLDASGAKDIRGIERLSLLYFMKGQLVGNAGDRGAQPRVPGRMDTGRGQNQRQPTSPPEGPDDGSADERLLDQFYSIQNPVQRADFYSEHKVALMRAHAGRIHIKAGAAAPAPRPSVEASVIPDLDLPRKRPLDEGEAREVVNAWNSLTTVQAQNQFYHRYGARLREAVGIVGANPK
jgi:hypothetical protein